MKLESIWILIAFIIQFLKPKLKNEWGSVFDAYVVATFLWISDLHKDWMDFDEICFAFEAKLTNLRHRYKY